MTGDDAYRWLTETARRPEVDPFDCHVVASILAVALAEAAATGRPVCDGVGLQFAELLELVADFFPAAVAAFGSTAGYGALVIDDEEQTLRDILYMYASSASSFHRHLAAMIARRCTRPHHLWQDLGLQDRSELSRLMRRHFTTLADRNHSDMKWKKFLYRLVCRSEGFTLCAAPICSDCDDFALCFGAEDGEAILARGRNGRELTV